MRCPVLTYALAVRCPVLTYVFPIRCPVLAMICPVLTLAVPLPDLAPPDSRRRIQATHAAGLCTRPPPCCAHLCVHLFARFALSLSARLPSRCTPTRVPAFSVCTPKLAYPAHRAHPLSVCTRETNDASSRAGDAASL
eukprot:1599936-Rhodomonas_salina.1